MATLASAVTSDGAQSGQSHTGPCTVMVHGDSVFDGATVSLEIADSDDANDYVPIDEAVFRNGDALDIAGRGTYFLRAVVANSGSSTSITIVTTQ